MFAMGWGAAFSKRATVKSYLQRAATLFLLGIIINLFEEYLPALLVPDSFGPLGESLPAILATDIYFFASLACLYFALKKTRGPKTSKNSGQYPDCGSELLRECTHRI